MPLFLVQRTFAEALDLDAHELQLMDAVNLEADVRWLESFLSADRLQAFCLYEAPSEQVIRDLSARSGMPIDTVIEVDGMLGRLITTGG